MIRISKASSNNVCITLTEKTTVTDPTYLFSFKHPESGEIQNFIAFDRSLYTDRYNEFTIVETSTNPDNTQGEVTLQYEGYWNYIIYAQTSDSNLDPNNADEIVEKGKVYVIPTSQTYNAPNTSIYDTINTFNG